MKFDWKPYEAMYTRVKDGMVKIEKDPADGGDLWVVHYRMKVGRWDRIDNEDLKTLDDVEAFLREYFEYGEE